MAIYSGTLSSEEFKKRRDVAYKEYTDLFTDSAKKILKIEQVEIRKAKHPFLGFEIDRKYYAIIHKINLKRQDSLENFIHFQKKASAISAGVNYSGYEFGSVKFVFSQVYDSIAKNIYIAYDQKLLYKFISGDSIINYHLIVKNLSFRYELNGPIDLLFEAEKENDWEKGLKEMNMNVMLYKKKDYVFIIVLYPESKGKLIDSHFLPDLIGLKLKEEDLIFK